MKPNFSCWFVYFLLKLSFEISGFRINDVTVVEDVLGSHELKVLHKLISNSTWKITTNIKNVEQKMSNYLSNQDLTKRLEKQHQNLSKSIVNMQNSVNNSQTVLENLYNGLQNKFTTFKNTFTQSLSNLKLFLEHQSRQFQTVLGKSNLASQQILASDCFDLYNLRYNASGTYWLQKFGQKVLCDMEAEGGGWLIIQRRANVSKQIDFNQDWFTYKIGFGNLDTEFWIGNDILHILTNQKPYELRIEMEDYENGTYYASYSNFRVGNEESNYILDIGNFSGNASDSFKYHHGRPFTTKDRDQDNYDDGNCASYFTGGWWYDRCYDAHLNGVYPKLPDRKNASFISWWLRNENMEKVPLVLSKVLIKIRPQMI